jgi:hypothetical protein
LVINILRGETSQDASKPYPKWPIFRRSVVAAFQRSLTRCRALSALGQCSRFAGRDVAGERMEPTLRFFLEAFEIATRFARFGALMDGAKAPTRRPQSAPGAAHC